MFTDLTVWMLKSIFIEVQYVAFLHRHYLRCWFKMPISGLCINLRNQNVFELKPLKIWIFNQHVENMDFQPASQIENLWSNKYHHSHSSLFRPIMSWLKTVQYFQLACMYNLFYIRWLNKIFCLDLIMHLQGKSTQYILMSSSNTLWDFFSRCRNCLRFPACIPLGPER